MNGVAEDETPEVDTNVEFPDGAPDVAIGGLSVARSTVMNRDSSPGANAPSEDLMWHVYGVSTEVESMPLALVGELQIRREGWFAAATSIALLAFRNADRIDASSDEAADALAEVLGPWASHALYDTAAAALRASVAVVLNCPIDVPRGTPSVHVARSGRPEGNVTNGQ